MAESVDTVVISALSLRSENSESKEYNFYRITVTHHVGVVPHLPPGPGPVHCWVVFEAPRYGFLVSHSVSSPKPPLHPPVL